MEKSCNILNTIIIKIDIILSKLSQTFTQFKYEPVINIDPMLFDVKIA